MMALDGKTIIKEEITEKDVYESTPSTVNSSRRCKAISGAPPINKESPNTSANSNGSSSTGSNSNLNNSNTSCRTPDSPESARAVAPRSPMSPQVHHSSLALPPRPNRNASASPVVNGANTTPPPATTQQQQQQQQVQQQQQQQVQVSAVAAVAAAAHVEQSRLLGKIRKFLGSLVQISQEVHPDVSERVRSLVLSLGSGNINIDDFRIALQEYINLPLRSYVIPLLKNHISLLQREIAAIARGLNQTPLQYVTNNESAVMEFAPHGPPTEYSDIFVQMDVAQANSLVLKRRGSESHTEHHNGTQEWSEYMASAYPPPPPAKRMHLHPGVPSEVRLAFGGNQPPLFDYSTSGANAQAESGFTNIIEKANHRDERDLRSNNASDVQRQANRGLPPNSSGGLGGEEEWKNIHTMLNCISAMVDKTKRAITILQQRGVEPLTANNMSDISPATLVEIRRQTEEKVTEFKRNAEEAVNQVKRQAVIEIQRAVVAAESRAAEVMTQERLRMEKFFVEMSRNSGSERDLDNKSPSITAPGQNACWNCGRKATETCSGCNLARYCGAFCQHKDWEHHHQICGTTRSTDLSNKHAVSQAIPLTAAAALRGGLVRSPPTPAQPPQAHSNSSASAQASSAAVIGALVTNGNSGGTK